MLGVSTITRGLAAKAALTVCGVVAAGAPGGVATAGAPGGVATAGAPGGEAAGEPAGCASLAG